MNWNVTGLRKWGDEATMSGPIPDVPGFHAEGHVRPNSAGRLVLTSLTVRPDDPDHHEIGAATLRKIAIGHVRDSMAEDYLEVLNILRDLDRDEDLSTGWERLGPKPIPDVMYARLAERFVQLIQYGSRSPIKELRQNTGWSRDTLAARIKEARRRGLLTSESKGVMGGQLTDRARQLLHTEEARRQGDEPEPPARTKPRKGRG